MTGSIRTTFNTLVTSYPHVEEFSKQVLAGGITRKILADGMPSDPWEAKAIRSHAKKFKKIIIKMDKDDTLAVATKVTHFIHKLKTSFKPNHPLIKELPPFLDALHESLNKDRHNNPVLLAVELLQNSGFLSAEDISFIKPFFDPRKFSLELCLRKFEEKVTETLHIIELCHSLRKDPYSQSVVKKAVEKYKEECRVINRILIDCTDYLPTVWLQLFERFQGNSEALALVFFLSYEELRETIWKLVRTFESSEVDKFVLILEDLSTTYSFWGLVDNFFRQNGRLQQCANCMPLLSYFYVYPKTRAEADSIWKTVVEHKNEIKFLSHLGRCTVSSLKNEINLLVESHERSSEDLAILFRLVKSAKRKYIWEQLIVEKGDKQVVAFLSHVGQRGAITATKFRKSITSPSEKWLNALIKKHKNDAPALVAISKLMTSETQRKELWDKVIVPHHLEDEFAACLQNKTK